MDLLPGLMVLNASLEGFSTAVAQVEIFELPSQLVTISLSPIDQKMRLVMNWGHLPDDLDLHVLQIDRSESNTSNTDILRQNTDSTDMVFNQKKYDHKALYIRFSGDSCETYYGNMQGCSGLLLHIDHTYGKERRQKILGFLRLSP